MNSGQLNWLIIIISLVISYNIGTINFSLIIGRLFYKVDVRKFYSKNAGATNASRVLGFKIGTAIFWLDVLKPIFALLITWGLSAIPARNLNGEFPYYWSGLAVIIGHIWPIWFKFKGGKGVSCFYGLILMMNPWFLLAGFCVWWLCFFMFKRISVSSLASTLVIAVICWIPQLSGLSTYTLDGRLLLEQKIVWFNQTHRLISQARYGDNLLTIDLVATIGALLIWISHYKNIIRIMRGEEKKYPIKALMMKKYKRQEAS